MWLIRSAIVALYPALNDTPSVAELDLDDFLVRYKRECPLLMWIGMVAGALVFTATPLLTVGIPLPSFLLPKAALDRHAHRIASHRWYKLRQLVMVLKMAGGMCWGQSAQVRGQYNLDPYPPDPGTWRQR